MMGHAATARRRRWAWLAISMGLVWPLMPLLGVAGGNTVEVCHQPPDNPSRRRTILLHENAVSNHLAHGDLLGPCADHGGQICADPNLNCDDGDPNTSVDFCDVASGGCVNLPITAESQDVSIDGETTILLNGNDPSGQDLTFSIEPGGPTQGSITAGPNPIQEAGACSEDASVACTVNTDCTATCVDGFCTDDPGQACTDPGPCIATCLLPPIASAEVTYSPNVAVDDDFFDSFDFRVTNPDGGFATATVNLNDTGEAPAAPPAIATIEVLDVDVEALEDTPVDIKLTGEAPDSVASLSFNIVTLPAGALTAPVPVVPPMVGRCSNDTDQVCETDSDCAGTCDNLEQPPTRQATVTYTAGAGPAMDSFVFEACDTGDPTSCSTTTATATIDIDAPRELALDKTVETNLNAPVTFSIP